MFVIVIGYVLKASIPDNNVEFMIQKHLLQQHQTKYVTDLEFVDDIAILSGNMNNAQTLLTVYKGNSDTLATGYCRPIMNLWYRVHVHTKQQINCGQYGSLQLQDQNQSVQGTVESVLFTWTLTTQLTYIHVESVGLTPTCCTRP